MRDWCGFENLCMFMATDQDFVMEMVEFWKNFVLFLLRRIKGYISYDSVVINEDMAYKMKSMISPAMVRKYLMPVWSAWADILKESGCKVVMLDSDGFIEELIPLWIESGINCCIPIEIAAGNDPVKIRKRYGKNMGLYGGIDKRLIAKGGKALENEVYRVVPRLLKDGGYIPSCDHGVPPDISWRNFVEYARLLARLQGWL
jgi:uroporphyrinogen decarboxylase